MKVLIFSDTHLTHRFDEKKFKFLERIISSSDKVIINGDFWDSSWTTFDKFINSGWSRLFPLLKERNAIYVYGNHDDIDQLDSAQINQFADKLVDNYTLALGVGKLFITHGHLVVPHLNSIHRFVKRYKFLEYIITPGISFIVYIFGKYYLRTFYRKMNNMMKEYARKNLDDKSILVCGHSHLIEKNIDNKFINLGCNIWGYRQYLIIEDGSVMQMSEH